LDTPAGRQAASLLLTGIAHAHDPLADDVYPGEPVEQAPPVFLKDQPEPGQEVIDKVGLFVVADRDTDRPILGLSASARSPSL
jgi:hypothetical protein